MQQIFHSRLAVSNRLLAHACSAIPSMRMAPWTVKNGQRRRENGSDEEFSVCWVCRRPVCEPSLPLTYCICNNAVVLYVVLLPFCGSGIPIKKISSYNEITRVAAAEASKYE